MKTKIFILYSFIRFVIYSFRKKNCFDVANSLSYVSLLSVVPLLAVIFTGLSAIPAFQTVLIEMEAFIFSNFIPTSSDVIRENIMNFVHKSSHLTNIGIISLLVIALLLMYKIDTNLNNIWSVKKKRSIVKTFLTYWAVLTLGPIFIGASLLATSYLTSLPIIHSTAETIGVGAGIGRQLIQLGAMLFTGLAFFLMYLVVPNTHVNYKHALIGALVATLLFELSKYGFAFYVSSNKTYQHIYGALSTIPIFLLWIYISWLVILIGAITARSLDLFIPNFKHHFKQNHFTSACNILFLLWLKSKKGLGICEQELINHKTIRNDVKIQKVLEKMYSNKWIHKTNEDQWHLSRDMSSSNFYQLYDELGYELPYQPQNVIASELTSKLVPELVLPIKIQSKKTLEIKMQYYFDLYEQKE